MERTIKAYGVNGETFNGYLIECPGCGMSHIFDSRWTFNNNFEKPTFTPSMLSKFTSPKGKVHVCHSFITDGQIRFLGDCTHEMKGKTVDLPAISDTKKKNYGKND